MMFYSLIFFVVGLFSALFFSLTVLMYLISIEFLVISLVLVLFVCYGYNSLFEFFTFLVMVVLESVLGLVLMLVLVSASGSDFMSFSDVI
uniref:NADH dehydrogenase subunit 4L n=1 Tax=Neoseiulus womersleyi TaxID=322050 RepID=A0A8F6YFM6_9ACAR|nr:NADH dehydrogenase subunit 4L [Neoseiulus womersleyi]